VAAKKISNDTLFNGRLLCCQHEEGYRFSVDAVLLSHFVRPYPNDSVLDLGAGCGVISLILAHRHAAVRLAALELQDDLLALLRHNISINHFDGRLVALAGDARHIGACVQPESFDLVVCNPPYGKADAGRKSLGRERLLARHEVAGTLSDFIGAAAFAVKNRGRVAFVLPAGRLAALINAMQQVRLVAKRLQVVHSYPGGVGRLVLLEAIKNGGEELQILPPFFIYKAENGDYTPEMAAMYA